ncbi:MAG: potassium-transporting ATPase subunit F [Proteobacteria bacterium]|nr:MAG: potassium-transporting ATPase subunit F [Pseudomonadota bacterium]
MIKERKALETFKRQKEATLEFLLAGSVACLLLVYLTYSIFRPDKF